MSKLAKKYIEEMNPNAIKIENPTFSYADLGNCYSYVSFNAIVDGEDYSNQLRMGEFFEWLFSSK